MNGSRRPDGTTGKDNETQASAPSAWCSWHSEMPELWHAGPRESEILFALRHPDLAEIKGRVGRWKATFVVDLEEPSRCSIEVIAEAAGLDTGVAERDGYARSEAFLDVARFPEIRFRSREIVPEDGDRRP